MTATTEELVNKVHTILWEDRRLTLLEIAEAAEIKYCTWEHYSWSQVRPTEDLARISRVVQA